METFTYKNIQNTKIFLVNIGKQQMKMERRNKSSKKDAERKNAN